MNEVSLNLIARESVADGVVALSKGAGLSACVTGPDSRGEGRERGKEREEEGERGEGGGEGGGWE